MIAYFNKFSISLTKEEALSVTGPGNQEENVRALIEKPRIQKQLSKISPEYIGDELEDYGIDYISEEWAQMSIVWIAAGNIVDKMHEKQKK